MENNKELKQLLNLLKLPSIPKNEWDGKTSFKDGITIISLIDGTTSYALSAFNAEEDKKPRIKRVFTCTPFTEMLKHFPVPICMDTDIENSDLSDEDKKKAESILEEAEQIEQETQEQEEIAADGYFFDEITNDEEAKAFIKDYNTKNGIKGRIPSNHETIVLRLRAIYNEQKK